MTLISSALNYLFQIYLGKIMLVSDYGSFNSINSFCTNMACVFVPVSVYLCREIARKNGDLVEANPELFDALVFTFFIFISLIIILGVAFGFGYSRRFDASNIEIFIILIIITTGLVNITSGIFQGANRFITIGIITLFLAIIKLCVTTIAFISVNNLFVPIVATLTSNVIVATVAIILLIKQVGGHATIRKFKPKNIMKKFVALYSATFLINAIISPYINGGEIIIMSGKYNMEDVGVYSLGITIARASIFIISMLSTVMLPKIANAKSKANDMRGIYFESIGVSFAIGVAWVLFIKFFAIYIIPYILGEAYYNALQNIKYMALWVINLGVLIMVNTYYLAINELKKYLIVISTVSVILYIVLKLCNIYFWYIPIILGCAAAIIIAWSIYDVLKCEIVKKEY